MKELHSSAAKMRIGVESDLLSRTATPPSGRSAISTHDWVAHDELRRHAIGEAITRAAPPCAAWPPSAARRITIGLLLGQSRNAATPQRAAVSLSSRSTPREQGRPPAALSDV